MRVFCLLLLAAFSVSAWADEFGSQRYDDAETDRLSVRLGSFFLRDSNTIVRIDSSGGGLGTVVDFEETLNVESDAEVGRLDGYYRFNPRHRIDFSYFKIDRDGTVTLLDDIDFGDEEFDAGAEVDTVNNVEIFKISYSYSFIHVRQFEFGIGAGLHVSTVTFGLDAPDLDTEERVEGTAPLPVFNFRGRYNFTPKLSLNGKFEWFFLEFEDYEGSFTDSVFTLEHQTFKNVGFGAGINRLNSTLSADDGDLRGEVESSTYGYLLFVNVGF